MTVQKEKNIKVDLHPRLVKHVWHVNATQSVFLGFNSCLQSYSFYFIYAGLKCKLSYGHGGKIVRIEQRVES